MAYNEQWIQTCSAGLRRGFFQSLSSIEQLRSIFILRLRWRNNVSLILCQINFCLFWPLWGLEVPRWVSLVCVRIPEIRLKDSCIVDQKAHNHCDFGYCHDTTTSLNETGRATSKFWMSYCCHYFFFNYFFFFFYFSCDTDLKGSDIRYGQLDRSLLTREWFYCVMQELLPN